MININGKSVIVFILMIISHHIMSPARLMKIWIINYVINIHLVED